MMGALERERGLRLAAEDALKRAWDEIPYGSESDQGLPDEIRGAIAREGVLVLAIRAFLAAWDSPRNLEGSNVIDLSPEIERLRAVISTQLLAPDTEPETKADGDG